MATFTKLPLAVFHSSFDAEGITKVVLAVVLTGKFKQGGACLSRHPLLENSTIMRYHSVIDEFENPRQATFYILKLFKKTMEI